MPRLGRSQPFPPILRGLIRAAASNVTLSTVAGSFLLTGNATVLGLTILEVSGSFVETGNAVTLDIALLESAGSFVEAGNAAGLGCSVATVSGSFAETGYTPLLDIALLESSGSFVVTGNDATLANGAFLAIASGSFALTGNAATFGVALLESAGSFVVTGSDATLASGAFLATTSGSFALTGNAASFGVALDGVAGAYTYTGYAATLSATGATLVGLRAALYAYLAADAGLTALVDERIYPVEPDEGDAPYPYLTYEIHRAKAGGMGHGLGRSYGRNLSGADGTSEAHITLTATSSLEADCIAIIRVLAAALDDFSGTLSDVEVMNSTIQMEFDAIQKPQKGSTHWIHQAGAIYRIRHRATPQTA